MRQAARACRFLRDKRKEWAEDRVVSLRFDPVHIDKNGVGYLLLWGSTQSTDMSQTLRLLTLFWLAVFAATPLAAADAHPAGTPAEAEETPFMEPPGAGEHELHSPIPPPLEEYQRAEEELGITTTMGRLAHRVQSDPFNLVSTVIFLLAILHTFLAGPIRKYAHKLEHEHHERIHREGRTAGAKPYENAKDDVSVVAQLLHFFGEVEAIFGIWLIPLMVGVTFFYGFGAFEAFVSTEVNYTEPMFVVVIMSMASTRPIIKFAASCLRVLAKVGGNVPSAWWVSILIVGPVLGSFITEPAAMTISAILLAKLFYRFDPPARLKYATIGLLFVNVSVGGTLTHFAAPPVLMVAGTWGWDLPYMFEHFGYKALTGIIFSTTVYYLIFHREFAELNRKAKEIEGYGTDKGEEPVPLWVVGLVLAFMTWTVLTLHHPPLFIGGFLFFMAFHIATHTWQDRLEIRGPLLVGFFLAALVTHGKLQQWWIEPVLASFSELMLFLGATFLTAFNDNAAITFLASQVPEFATNEAMQNAVVFGAVTGGGFTVIANAPNPAGQSILQRFFGESGVSPLHLALWATVPTIIVGTCFWFLPHMTF